ncbi:FAS1 domain-containing protein [Xylogone sp. PMI_703]|nr:FAS1 domain-containing protein [Xylogone sp. PMI_703]
MLVSSWWLRCLVILSTLAAQCSSLFILSTIANRPELSTLQSYVKQLPELSALLSQADNYTYFAPTDTAFQKWFSAADPAPTLDEIEATLTYCLVHGIYPVASFTKSPQFVSSFLVNATYTNVTSGQTLELVLNNNSVPYVMSGLRSNSSIATSDIVVTGGIMQLINTIPELPPREPVVVQQANLSFFVALLTKGGFLDTDRDEFATQMEYLPDVTYFAPNSAAALANFLSPDTVSPERLTSLFDYHVVTGFIGYSPTLSDKLTLQTVQGTNLTIRVGPDGTRWVNGAKIITSDYMISNGVLHTLDNFLDPQNVTSPHWKSSHKSLSPGAMAGLIGGLIVLLSCGAFLIFLFFHRTNPQRQGRIQLRQSDHTRSPFGTRFIQRWKRVPRNNSRSNFETEIGSHNFEPSHYTSYRSAETASRGEIAELEAVKTRTRSWDLPIQELDGSEPRSLSEKEEEMWERYPAERYQNRHIYQ